MRREYVNGTHMFLVRCDGTGNIMKPGTTESYIGTIAIGTEREMRAWVGHSGYVGYHYNGLQRGGLPIMCFIPTSDEVRRAFWRVTFPITAE